MTDIKKTIDDGFLIIFDGIDGAGKTTQLVLVKKEFDNNNWHVHTTRNLGGSPIGEELRNVVLKPIERPALTELYISVAIQEALIENLTKERENGSIILMDRGQYLWSPTNVMEAK